MIDSCRFRGCLFFFLSMLRIHTDMGPPSLRFFLFSHEIVHMRRTSMYRCNDKKIKRAEHFFHFFFIFGKSGGYDWKYLLINVKDICGPTVK